MTALPSFCELMASLGLDAEPQTSGPGVSGTPLHSRTPSTASTASSRSISRRLSPEAAPALQSSPSIVISHHGTNPDADRGRRNSVSRPSTARYAPYAVVDRRGSVPTLSTLSAEDEQPIRLRSASTSPKLSASLHRKPSALQLDKSARRRERLSISEKDFTMSMPISSLARRKSPQNSPVAATFAAAAHARRTPSPPMVAIPMLPTMMPFTFPARADDGVVARASAAPSRRGSRSPGQERRRALPTGVRLSAASRFDNHAHHHGRDVAPIA